MAAEMKQEKREEKRECGICCSVKKSVFSCPYCEYLACTQCCERVILDSINNPSCVSCKKEYSSDFFYETFTSAFITKRYKAHREKMLYEKEKSLLPATQVEVERRLKKEQIEEKIRDLKLQMLEIKRQIIQATNELYEVDREKGDEKAERKEFVCQCPSNDCRGFLSTKYKCGMCGIQACPECREIKRDDHKCDPNTIETVKELQKTTRACPNCQTRIFKIEGCDQMWCTQCNVAFCWKTGRVEKGIIHNPHYFEYLRKAGQEAPRNPHEVRCGGMPDIRQLPRKFKGDFDEEKVYSDGYKSRQKIHYAEEIYRMVNHTREVTLRQLPTPIDNLSNLDLRVDFMMKKIDEDTFKTKLQRREKDRTKKLEQRDILDMYCNVVQDLFTAVMNNAMKIDDFFDAELKIRQHTSDSYINFNQKYKSNVKCPIWEI